MTILLIIVAIAFTLRMLIAMLEPFWSSRHEQLSYELLDEEFREVESLVARKVALIQALRDIEYDWDTNKISRDDYERFKLSCERQAVGVMRRLDAIHGGDQDWEALIDEAVADRLADPTEAGPEQTPTDPATPESSADTLICGGCDAPLTPDDRYCSQCGTPVEPADEFDAMAPYSRPSEVAG